MKRLTAIILCICICALLIPPFALAEDEGTDMPESTPEITEITEEPKDENECPPTADTEETPEENKEPENGEPADDTREPENGEQTEETEETAEEELVAEDASFAGEKEKLHIILISGQSNAAVGTGKLDTKVISPEPGNGYVWTGAGLMDMAEYVYIRGTTDCVGKSIGFYPAIAAEWYALTGEKAVIIEAGYSGCSIDKWSTYGWTAQDVGNINSCIDYINTSLSDSCEIVGGGFYWLQGESDSALYPDPDGILCYKTTPEYETYFLPVYSAYISAFRNKGIANPYCGILTCRSWSNQGSGSVSEYCGVRAAQQHLANTHSDIIMASVLTDTWLRNSSSSCTYSAYSGEYCVKSGAASKLFAVVHYSQTAYNIMGLEAADSVYRAMNCGVTAGSFTVYGHNATRTYESGSTIYLEDNLRKARELNPGEWKAAQIVFFPTPSCGRCGAISLKLTRMSDGTEVPIDGIMEESGYFPDIFKLTEDMTLTVTLAGVTKSFTLARKSYSPVTQEEGFYAFIPDANFVRALKDRFGPELTAEQAALVTELDVSGCGIADLGGIGYFTALETLDCSDNSILSLDLSGNVNLKTLDCSNNLLSVLDIAGNEQLASLSADGNRLKYFDNELPQLYHCSLGSQNATGLKAYRTDSGRFLLDMQSLVGSARLDRIGGISSAAILPETSCPELIVVDELPDTFRYSFTTEFASRMDVSVGVELSDEPAVKALQDYLILPAGKTQTMDIDAVSGAVRDCVSTVWTVKSEEGGSDLLEINGADITAKHPGTAIVTATVSVGTCTVGEVEVRIDVTEYDVTDPVTGVTGVSLAVNKADVELFSSYFAEVEILPEMAQLSVSLSGNSSLIPVNTGVAVEKAEFSDSSLNNLFALVPYGDSTLRIVPTDGAVSSPSAVAKTYKSSINVYFRGKADPFTTGVLTLKVKKTVPKIKASAVKLNSWAEYKGNSAALRFSGGTVTAVEPYPAGSALSPDWLELDAENMSVTYSGLARAKKSGSMKLLCTVKGWERIPVAVSVSVSAAPTAPAMKFSKSSVTVTSGTFDRAQLTWSMTAKEYESTSVYPVSVTYILEGSNYKQVSYENGEVLTVEVDNANRTVTVSNARNDGRNHTYKVFLYCAGKEFSFTVKTVSKAVSMKLKASGSVNLLVENSPVALTPTVKNISAFALVSQNPFTLDSVVPADGGADCSSQFVLSGYSGGKLNLTAKTGEVIPAGSYIATVSLKYSGERTVSASAKFTVKSIAETVSVSAKPSGSIDLVRSATAVTVTPSWKNCYTHAASENDIRIYVKIGKQYTDCSSFFTVTVSGDKYRVQAKAGSEPVAGKYFLRIETDEAVSPYRTFTVKKGKVPVKASTKNVNLFLKDRYDEENITLTLTDTSLNPISDVKLNAAGEKYFSLRYTGDGHCVIGWKDNIPAAMKRGAAKSVKLLVTLEGCGGTAATVTVKVYAG